MDLARRAACGRLAERFGRAALPPDLRARHLRLEELSATLVERASADAIRWLDAYAAGVNAWLDSRGRDLPPEFRLLRATPEPWRPADSMAVSLAMAMELSLLPLQAKETRHGWLRAGDTSRTRDLLAAAILGTAEPGGSNAFVAHGKGGGVWLGNDTHLLMRLPPWWFRALLRAPGFEAAGWTLPGFPAVVAGFNGKIAWGVTTHMLDDYDVYLEDFDENGGTVRRGTERVAVQTDEVRIRVGRDEVQTVTRRRTDIGPMLPPDASRALPPRSIAWTALHAGRPMDAMLTIARASTLDDVARARESYVAPAMNLVACDRAGASLFMLLGRVPDRPAAGDVRLPLDASRRELHWRGLREAATNPIRRVAPGEHVVSGNDEQLRRFSARFYPAEFDSPSRVVRMRELLGRGAPAAAVQLDEVSPLALELVRALAAFTPDGDAARALALLRGWDGRMGGAGAAALYRFFTRELFAGTFGDVVNVAEVRVSLRERLLAALLRRELETEPRAADVHEALAAAWRTCVRRWGGDPARWAYRDVHKLTLRHPFSAKRIGHLLFGRGPFGVTGSTSAPVAFDGDWAGDARDVIRGAAFRWVVDLADPDRSVAILPGGQSGHPGDRHYDDQLPLFLAGETLPVAWSAEAVARAAVSTLLIEPAVKRE